MSSASLASAKNRRANIQPPRPIPVQRPPAQLPVTTQYYQQQQQQQQVQPQLQQVQPGTSGKPVLSLPQIIGIIDDRLVKVENLINQNKISSEQTQEIPQNLQEILADFDERHTLLATEIGTLKNIVMNLQSFTMEVNKKLFDMHLDTQQIDEPLEEPLPEDKPDVF